MAFWENLNPDSWEASGQGDRQQGQTSLGVGGRALDVVSVPGLWVMGSSPEESISASSFPVTAQTGSYQPKGICRLIIGSGVHEWGAFVVDE